MIRGHPSDLTNALRPSSSPRDAHVAAGIADAIGEQHLAFPFFAAARGHSGFPVDRV